MIEIILKRILFTIAALIFINILFFISTSAYPSRKDYYRNHYNVDEAANQIEEVALAFFFIRIYNLLLKGQYVLKRRLAA